MICSSNLSFEVSDKYKINYEELEFDQLVSSGSAGEVYLGYYFGTPVAIKSKQMLHIPYFNRTIRTCSWSEASCVQRIFYATVFQLLSFSLFLRTLNHPNIVQFLGICDHTSGIYLITEYVENGDLCQDKITSYRRPLWPVNIWR